MEYFISFRFTGEDPAMLAHTIPRACAAVRAGGHAVFCSYEMENEFRARGFDAPQIYAYCLKRFEASDALLCLVRTEDRSSGIAMEIERSRSLGKPITLAVHRTVSDEFLATAYGLPRRSCERVLEYEGLDDLCAGLRGL